MPKIVVNNKVREILAELDRHIARYSEQTSQLAPDSRLATSDLMHIGAERELQKGIILGCAYRLNKASTGRE